MLNKVFNPNPIDTVDPKFYKLNEKELNLIKTLMKFLPKKNEPPNRCLIRHYKTVQALLYLNKNIANYIENNFTNVKTMSLDRVKNLQSPYLLRHESYNFYVLRMKNMNIIPFHIDFFKKKFDLFKDEEQTLIFDELEVDF
ncbi:uncharacterized protein LOC113553093 [Rhopalosiphum maidis]|uniref:uncharacterized protein LOC113553093 n=1 Tax=Rhopalosiphum maidis TaxID=43146 RepID=UPI000EFF648C|nr:uncharacterized protein LOC113553093 [Rhopalosiphum maidis]